MPLYLWGCPSNLANFGLHHNEGYYLAGVGTAVLGVIGMQFLRPQLLVGPLLGHVLGDYLPIKTAPQYVSPEAVEEETCGICLLEFEPGDRLIQTPCEHVFHDGCLQEWLMVKLQCPTCRSELPPI